MRMPGELGTVVHREAVTRERNHPDSKPRRTEECPMNRRPEATHARRVSAGRLRKLLVGFVALVAAGVVAAVPQSAAPIAAATGVAAAIIQASRHDRS